MNDIRFDYNGLLIATDVDKVLADNCGHRYTLYYERHPGSELNALCDKYGSDKGEIASSGHPYPWPSHTYADLYESLFGHCREAIRHVFECGLGTNNPELASSMGAQGRPGASLRMWRDYFPNAEICGADIDRDILFQEDRISTFHVDQTSPDAIRHLWEQVRPVPFDLMIDDGLHTFEAGRCLFENSFQQLRAGGIYVIEDLAPGSMLQFRSYFKESRHKVEYVQLVGPARNDAWNSMVIIRK